MIQIIDNWIAFSSTTTLRIDGNNNEILITKTSNIFSPNTILIKLSKKFGHGMKIKVFYLSKTSPT